MAKTPVLVQDIDRATDDLGTKTAAIDKADVGFLDPIDGAPSSSQFRSEITNRAPIRDLAKIPAPLMGTERIDVRNIQLIEGETGPSEEVVYGLPDQPLDRVRFVGGWSKEHDAEGDYIKGTDGFIEVTFYGTGLNLIWVEQNGGRDIRVTLDGGIESGDLTGAVPSGVISGREYRTHQKLVLTSGNTLGLHTAKIRLANTDTYRFQGFEVINEASTITVPTGSGILAGSDRYSMPATALGYSLASDFDSASDDPTTDGKGGAVVVYSERQVDGSVEVKQRLSTTDSTRLNLGSADHSNEEVVQRFHWQEFGAGRSDDFSTLPSSGSNAAVFTLADGTTTLVGHDVRNRSANDGQLATDANGSFIALTFVGTGLSLLRQDDANGGSDTYEVIVDGSSVGNLGTVGSSEARVESIVSGLPYGTHTVRIERITAATWNFGVQEFLIYAPKKPSIPEGAGRLGSYYLMADFSEDVTGYVDEMPMQQGSIGISSTREWSYYNGGGTWSLTGPDPSASHHFQLRATGAEVQEYTFFGTGFSISGESIRADVEISLNQGAFVDVSETNFTISHDGGGASGTGPAINTFVTAGGTFTTTTGNIDSSVAGQDTFVVEGFALGLHTIRFTATGSHRPSWSSYSTPIHSYESSGELLHDRLVGANSLKAETGLSDFTKGKQRFPDGVDLGKSKTKFQTKFLSAAVTTTITDIDDLRFSGLTVGKSYRITLQAQVQHNASVAVNHEAFLTANCGSDFVVRAGWRTGVVNTGTGVYNYSAHHIFTASASILSVDSSVTDSGLFLNGGNDTITFATLEELPNHIETDEW